MRLAFLGSDPFAVPSLEALAAAGHEVVLVVTNPDRPRGRSGTPAPTAVKEAALRLGAPLYQPEGRLGGDAAARVAASGAELGVVVAFGSFLGRRVREAPARRLSINVHASLLPRWRGAAPDAAAILAGDAVTGVTVQKVDARLDAGDVLLARATPIEPHEPRGALRARLAQLGAPLVVEAVRLLEAGEAAWTPQDEAQVTHAPTLGKEDGRLDWARPALELARRVRACDPWPTGWVPLAAGPLQVLRARALPWGGPAAPPGAVLDARAGGPDLARGLAEAGLDEAAGAGADLAGALLVATGAGALALVEVRPAGKKAMPGAAWARGRRLAPGDVLA